MISNPDGERSQTSYLTHDSFGSTTSFGTLWTCLQRLEEVQGRGMGLLVRKDRLYRTGSRRSLWVGSPVKIERSVFRFWEFTVVPGPSFSFSFLFILIKSEGIFCFRPLLGRNDQTLGPLETVGGRFFSVHSVDWGTKSRLSGCLVPVRHPSHPNGRGRVHRRREVEVD